MCIEFCVSVVKSNGITASDIPDIDRSMPLIVQYIVNAKEIPTRP